MEWLLERARLADFGAVNLQQRLDTLSVDEALLTFDLTNATQPHAWLYALSHHCQQCPFELLSKVGSDGNDTITVSTKQDWTFLLSGQDEGQLITNSSSEICNVSTSLGQFGVYALRADKCEIETLHEPVNIYIPLFFVLSILLVSGVVLGLIWAIVEYCKSRRQERSLELNKETEEQTIKPSQHDRRRVSSLDTFRGISILLMIFVNDGAGGYEIMEHVTWNGLHLADFVFPWFLWIMGVCIPISVKSQMKRTSNRIYILFSIFKRSCILFGLGVMLNTLHVGWQMETLRVFGVLQRFGILYFLVASICTICWPSLPKMDGRWLDLNTIYPQWIIHFLLHGAHLLLIFLLPVPGCPNGYLGPGGISENGLYENCTGGVTGYVDKLILGDVHLYQYPSTRIVYRSGPFDPEGPYGCLPSLLTVFLGVQAGAILLSFKKSSERLLRWFIWGIVSLGLGFAISFIIPINKNLWSTSFSLTTCGAAFLVLFVCYVLVDAARVWTGSPFVYPGMNATVMYVGHMVAFSLWPWHWNFQDMNTHLLLLLENLWGVLLWTLIAASLYRRKWFLSI